MRIHLTNTIAHTNYPALITDMGKRHRNPFLTSNTNKSLQQQPSGPKNNHIPTPKGLGGCTGSQ
jgi:hypothetical protein